jgi:hypothetical protein
MTQWEQATRHNPYEEKKQHLDCNSKEQMNSRLFNETVSTVEVSQLLTICEDDVR